MRKMMNDRHTPLCPEIQTTLKQGSHSEILAGEATNLTRIFRDDGPAVKKDLALVSHLQTARPAGLPMSRCLPVVILEHPAEALPAPDRAGQLTDAFFRLDQLVVKALMIALAVIMNQV